LTVLFICDTEIHKRRHAMADVGYFFIGLVVGIVGTSISWFFIAKNNKGKLVKAFAAVDNLPQQAKDILAKFGIK